MMEKFKEIWTVEYSDGDKYFCHSREERDQCLALIEHEGDTPKVYHDIEYRAYSAMRDALCRLVRADGNWHLEQAAALRQAKEALELDSAQEAK